MTVLESLCARLRETGLYRLDGSTQVDAELRAYSCVLEPLRLRLEGLMNERFAATAQGTGLLLAEERLGMEAPKETPEERRNAVLALGAIGSQSFSKNSLILALAALSAPADIAEQPEETRLYVSFSEEVPAALGRKAAERVLPAHLGAVLDFRTVDWNALDARGKTWQALDAEGKTWDALEEAGRLVFRLE